MSEFARDSSCPFCRGSGRCARCHGRGELGKIGSLIPRRKSPCRACRTTGVCHLCHGSGTVPRAAVLEPAAVRPDASGPQDGTLEGVICDWRARVVIEVLAGRETLEDAGKRLDIPPATVREWTMRFVRGGERAIDSLTGVDPTDRADDLRSEVERLSDELERLRERLLASAEDRSSQRRA